ncbi:MAG: class II glutamine amidotransferase [Coriobacteriales bacterium]|jgi:glutamine amidotransferase|nr:class II glutamine amidotransferase [Coriobacteriales bacterium]
MCQLFALSARQPQSLNSTLFEFFTHADKNPHGWGYADFAASPPEIIRSPERADVGPLAARFLTHPHVTHAALAHIRYATIGQVELANCHPFAASDVSGRSWTLMHKGTIFDYPPLNPYFEIQEGSTDSERITLYLLDWINAATENKGAPLVAEERFAVFSYLVEVLSPGNCVNLVVHDGEYFFIYSNYLGGLNILTGQGGVLFCTSELAAAFELSAFAHPAAVAQRPASSTAPLQPAVLATGQPPVPAVAPPPAWQPLTLCTPLGYQSGELVFSGAAVGEQYFDKAEDTRYLYQDYAAL